jgi:tetratricopeptide (TPR) repeat protein
VRDLIAGGEFDQARTLLQGYLDENPVSGTIVFLQGQTELKAGNYAKAETLFRKSAAIAPELGAEIEVENARALQKGERAVMARASRLIQDRSTAGSGVDLLETYLRDDSRNFAARTLLAETYLSVRNSIKGLYHYSQALSAADPAQLQKLEARFAEIAAQSPRDAFALNLLGRTQLRLDRIDEAADTLHKATQLAEGAAGYAADEALAIVAQGREQLQRGNVAEGLARMEQAYLLDPASSAVKLGRAEAYTARAEKRVQLGDLARATADFEKAARDSRVPGGEVLRERIASGVYSVGRRLEARRIAAGDDIGAEIVAFQAAYDIDPDNLTYKRKLAETRSALGDQHLADGDYEDAAASYRRAYELFKSNATYKTSAINAYRLDGDQKLATYQHDAAISAYRFAYELDSADSTSKTKLATGYNTAGVYYRALDQRSRAADYFREALRLYPDNQEYQDNYNSVFP